MKKDNYNIDLIAGVDTLEITSETYVVYNKSDAQTDLNMRDELCSDINIDELLFTKRLHEESEQPILATECCNSGYHPRTQ